MLKTLKESEFESLINKKEFLMDYFKYLSENSECLLNKILGIYKLQVGKDPIYFMICENIIGADAPKVIRNFSLKGQVQNRKVAISRD
jgi:hypothetical protein